MRYYIADCHFFHHSLLTKMDKRGFNDVLEMNEYMIDKWNKKVRPNDEVIILGDLSLGNAKETNELLKRLNGILFLITGNHDRFSSSDYENKRFVWIKPYAEMHDNKRKVVLCHYPIICYNGQYRRNEHGLATTYMLYGHVHNTYDEILLDRFIKETRNSQKEGPDGIIYNIPCQMINCFCMFSNYEPLSLDEWIINDAKRRGSLT